MGNDWKQKKQSQIEYFSHLWPDLKYQLKNDRLRIISGKTLTGGDVLPFYSHEKTAEYVDSMFENLTSTDHNLAFLYAASPDAAGHIYGPDSNEVSVLRALQKVCHSENLFSNPLPPMSLLFIFHLEPPPLAALHILKNSELKLSRILM